MSNESETLDRELQKKCDSLYLHDVGEIENLIKKGASAKSFYEYTLETPLHFVCKTSNSTSGKQIDAAAILLQNGANINALDEHGCSPIFNAIASDNSHELVKFLHSKGADLMIITKYGDTLLHVTGNECIKNAEFLLDHKVDVNYKKEDGLTPLHVAIEGGADKIVKLLIKAGADLNVYDDNGMTPLIGAITAGKGKIAEALILAGADINKRDKMDDATRDYYMTQVKKKNMGPTLPIDFAKEKLKETLSKVIQK